MEGRRGKGGGEREGRLEKGREGERKGGEGGTCSKVFGGGINAPGKIYLYFCIGNAQPREPALCQLFRHIFVPYDRGI